METLESCLQSAENLYCFRLMPISQEWGAEVPEEYHLPWGSKGVKSNPTSLPCDGDGVDNWIRLKTNREELFSAPRKAGNGVQTRWNVADELIQSASFFAAGCNQRETS